MNRWTAPPTPVRTCLQCQYNLRGLPHDTVRCPECGTLNPLFTRYTFRRRLFSWGYDYTILDRHGAELYLVRTARASLLRRQFVIRDLDRQELATVREQPLAVSLTYYILRPEHGTAVVRQRRLSVRPQYKVFEIEHADEALTTLATTRGHRILDGEEPRAVILRRHWPMWVMFDVDVAEGADTILMLAAAIVIQTQR